MRGLSSLTLSRYDELLRGKRAQNHQLGFRHPAEVQFPTGRLGEGESRERPEGMHASTLIPPGPSRGVSEKPVTRFCTGSKYLGEWNEVGISGKGIYKFAHGVIYDGTFNADGEFHGLGTLVYPNGQRLEGIWKNGKLAPHHSCVTQGGVVMTDQYCKMPDRRFHVEVKDGFGAPGSERLTNEPPPSRSIPDGCYDVGGGYYDPGLKCIVAYARADSLGPTLEELIAERETKWRSAFSKMMSESITEAVFKEAMKGKMVEQGSRVMDIPSPVLEAWIIENCRKGWDENVGYRPELYEEWTTGARNKQ